MLVGCKGGQLKCITSLVCPICLCSFEEVPKILPKCGHSFCGPCLEQWMLASGSVESGLLRCPVCKRRTSLRLPRNLRRYFQNEDYSDNGDRQFEAECTLNYLVRRLLPDNPMLAFLYKSCKKGLLFRKKRRRKLASTALQNLLKCPVCKEDFKEQPRMLPSCLHSLCMNCLERAYKRSDEEFGFIACPSCWKVHSFRNDCDELYQYDGGCEKLVIKPRWTASGPPKEKLGSCLPFDYVLRCMWENAPVIEEELGA